MILTTCAACAAPLAHDASRCVRCKTRYCDSTCQHDHWRRGHKQICKKIHRGGNAEQYHADNKYKEAVAVAAEACADDTKGQTCYICTEAVHWKTKEGIVRGCACRGTAGFAHVSCLAEQVKILVVEAEENNLGAKALNERWELWFACNLCEQRYHGVVHCALGWACWKTYLGRAEENWLRSNAMRQLGSGLQDADHHMEALSVKEVNLSTLRRLGASEGSILAVQGNIANTYQMIGMEERALSIRREVYIGHLRLYGENHRKTLLEANNLASLLIGLQRFKEVRSLLRKALPVARRLLGAEHEVTLSIREDFSGAILEDGDSSAEEKRKAVRMLEDTIRVMRRVLGTSHPTTLHAQKSLDVNQKKVPTG